MSWKGTFRTIGVAVRAAERDAKRRQRELEKRKKHYAKMEELEQAEYEVELYENHIEIISSLHKECRDVVNWRDVATSAKPLKPENIKAREMSARTKQESYVPGIIDRVFKREQKVRDKLEGNLLEAIKEDELEYKNCILRWEEECERWAENVEFAQAILDGDVQAKLKVIEDFEPFSEISNLGTSLTCSIQENGIFNVVVKVHGDEIVPSEVKSLLSSGRLSVKKMSVGRFNEMYQDYVCSCILRVASEIFSALPEDMVVVTAVDNLLNEKTGHMELLPILSVCFSRTTMESLNLDAIDPSESMTNFVHNMSFKKNKGFEAVAYLQPNFN
jgi:hypothetical protein